MSKKLKNIGFLGLILLISFLFFNAVGAQSIDPGINEINNTIKLSNLDPRVIAARVINIILSLLGVIAVVLIVYAGFLWMTSDGNEDKIDKAKAILKNAVIGLAIILASWGITYFVLNKLLAAVNPNPTPSFSKQATVNLGLSALGSCTIESIYPASDQKNVPRNTAILVTFKEAVKLSTVCEDTNGNGTFCDSVSANGVSTTDKIRKTAVQIYKTVDGSDQTKNADATAQSVDGKIFVFTPASYLGSSTENTPYTVKLTNEIQKSNGDSIFKTCSVDWFEWKFTVSSKLDLTPPQVISVFPFPDNQKDAFVSAAAVQARGSLEIFSQPRFFVPAKVDSVEPNPYGAEFPNATVTVNQSYNQGPAVLTLTVIAGGTKATLSKGNIALGVANFNNRSLNFPAYFTLSLDADPEEGNSWRIELIPMSPADTLTIGSETYTFTNGNSDGNNVAVGSSLGSTFSHLTAKLLNNPDLDTPEYLSPTKITLIAKTGGANGNNTVVSSSNQAALAASSLSGGADNNTHLAVNEKKDQPRNSVIQINFNEAINPLNVNGSAEILKNRLRVINANPSAEAGGQTCASNEDCLSYKCQGTCVKDYIAGNFTASPDYLALDFVPDLECGMNGCGEKIYCLPSNSNLAVQVLAADLKPCNPSGQDCASFGDFNTCSNVTINSISSTVNPYNVCRNSSAKNYPQARVGLIGVVDLANNSLDGNRDFAAAGSAGFFNQNLATSSGQDGFQWSFFINDQIALEPPVITAMIPNSSALLGSRVEISFNSLMMRSTLKTGSATSTSSSTEAVNHKFLNVFNYNAQPLGYWIYGENLDIASSGNPLDGYPDITRAIINHSGLSESTEYNAQAGSGLRNIYQNCFKPSKGPDGAFGTCIVSDINPSCCFGEATSTLDSFGNCLPR